MPEPGEGQVLVRVTRAGDQLRRHPRARELLPRALRAAADPRRRGGGRRARRRASGVRRRSSAPAATPSTPRRRRRRRSRSPTASSDARRSRCSPGPDRVAPATGPRAQLAAGESVVVHAAAGGVGSLAVQLAKRFGAGRVIATASTRGEARAGARARRRRRGRRHARGPRRRAARGQRRRSASTSCSRWRAGACSTQSLRRARAVRPARHLRHRVARAEQVSTGALMRRSQRRRRLLAHALLRPPAGDGRRAAAGAVRARRRRRAARGRGREYGLSEARRAHEDMQARAHEREARARPVAVAVSERQRRRSSDLHPRLPSPRTRLRPEARHAHEVADRAVRAAGLALLDDPAARRRGRCPGAAGARRRRPR